MTEETKRGAPKKRQKSTQTGNSRSAAARLLEEYRKALNAPDAPPTEEQLAFERKLAGYRARRAAIMGRTPS